VIKTHVLPEIGIPQKEEKFHYKKLMDEKAKQLACPNEQCKKYGKIGEGNISFRNQYGDQPSQNLFRCKLCNKTFSERKETPFFGFHLPEETILAIIRCLVEGNGTRATARICNVHRDTVTKIIRQFFNGT
jgi:transposase-like protein